MRNGLDAQFSGEAFRKNHPMIIASNRHLASIQSVRLAEGNYLAGQVISYDSADGLYKKYSEVSGTKTADAVLFTDVQSASGTTSLERGIFSGEVYEDLLIDLNAQAKTDLGAKTIVNAEGLTILKF